MTQAVIFFSPDFRELAENELRRAQSKVEILNEIAPGVLLIRSPASLASLAVPWLKRPPIYIHHLSPVQASIPLQHPGDLFETLDELRTAIRSQLLGHFKQRVPFSVQARVFDWLPVSALFRIESELETLIKEEIRLPLDVRRPRQALSVVIGEKRAFLGVSAAALNLSPWPGGAPPFPADPNRVNRAEQKLMEAVEIFRIRLCPGQHALDLGASPGGWTRVLLLSGLRVTAVDPQPLLPSLFFHPSVTYEPVTAEEFLARKPGEFDFIANDMVMHPQDSARLMVAYAKHLKPGGTAVMTLKLGSLSRSRVMDHCFRILRKAYRIPRVRQLYYNRSEVTAWLKKLSVP